MPSDTEANHSPTTVRTTDAASRGESVHVGQARAAAALLVRNLDATDYTIEIVRASIRGATRNDPIVNVRLRRSDASVGAEDEFHSSTDHEHKDFVTEVFETRSPFMRSVVIPVIAGFKEDPKLRGMRIAKVGDRPAMPVVLYDASGGDDDEEAGAASVSLS